MLCRKQVSYVETQRRKRAFFSRFKTITPRQYHILYEIPKLWVVTQIWVMILFKVGRDTFLNNNTNYSLY